MVLGGARVGARRTSPDPTTPRAITSPWRTPNFVGVMRHKINGPSPLPQRFAEIRTGRGPKAPGQRPRRPRPAPAPPPAGASRPPGRAPACRVPGPAGLQGTVLHGRGKRGAFPVPAPRAIPFPGSGGFFRQAGGQVAVSAPRQEPGSSIRAWFGAGPESADEWRCCRPEPAERFNLDFQGSFVGL